MDPIPHPTPLPHAGRVGFTGGVIAGGLVAVLVGVGVIVAVGRWRKRAAHRSTMAFTLDDGNLNGMGGSGGGANPLLLGSESE